MSKRSYQNGSLAKTTYYIRDGSGSLLSTYEKESSQTSFAQTEVPVYGGSRLGLYDRLASSTAYELKDHLGNVRAIVGKPATNEIGVAVHYYADYYPFGCNMRKHSSQSR